MRFVAMVVAGLWLGCSGEGGSSSSGSGGTGGGCQTHADCPGGFACKARVCVTHCDSDQPLVGGCVVGATCSSGTCVNNSACTEQVGCAYDKGQVCEFSSHTCVAASESCTEGETETLCGNGYTCHVSVCYHDCEGTKGCPQSRSCGVDHQCH